ncbi:hypothetical protein ANO11243_065340 [Dothideomycetidae sp. 11243]|nr:hypothetical protein ANO11243_065340 [fungal sp. No.11243]
MSSSPPPAEVKKEKKRKRTDPKSEELEIDVSLPEPPSKKALRRAKKGKTGSGPRASLKDVSDLQEESGDEPKPSPADGANKSAEGEVVETDATGAKTSKRSEHGIWIGNLAFHITPSALREFLISQGGLTADQITRVNLPVTNRPLAPFQVRLMKTNGKTDIPQYQNKGFAYVDFDSQGALFQALQVTETELEGRRVLVKDAKNFAGRPDKPKPVEGAGEDVTTTAQADGKPRSKRIFVGNLAFDVTRDDIQTHFAQAGEVEDVFLASFEDTGKCKGYGWVRFSDEDAAECAVKGWIWKTEDNDDDEDDEEENEDGNDEDDEKAAKKKQPKKRKWWINKLYGRQLRCEFAEDASTRYKKRYGGKGAPKTGEGQTAPIAEVNGADAGEARQDFTRENKSWKTARGSQDQRAEQRRQKHRDARKVAPGMALASAPRASGAIVEAKGTKVKFDD